MKQPTLRMKIWFGETIRQKKFKTIFIAASWKVSVGKINSTRILNNIAELKLNKNRCFDCFETMPDMKLHKLMLTKIS
jgi:hypothetical protein